MTVFGRRDDTLDEHHGNIEAVLDAGFDILLDNGADLAAGLVQDHIGRRLDQITAAIKEGYSRIYMTR